MRVAILGRTKLLLDSAEKVSKDHQIVLVGTGQAAPEYSAGPGDFKRFADQLRIPYFCSGDIGQSEIQTLIEQADPEIAISVNWPSIIPPGVLDLFPHGVVNAHCGDLPRYRGNAVPNWAILQGEDRLVLTLHLMSAELDAGPILLQREMALDADTYIEDAYVFMAQQLPSMFEQVLSEVSRGVARPQEQSDAPGAGLRCYPRVPGDGVIDWTRPAADVCRLVRASGRPFAGAFSPFLESPGRSIRKLTIWRARVLSHPDGAFLAVPGHVIHLPGGGRAVACGQNTLLALEEIEVDGVPTEPAEVFRSARQRLGSTQSAILSALEARIEQLEQRSDPSS